MTGLRKANLYFHTLRYLRPIQIWGRILFLLSRTKPDLRVGPTLRPVEHEWVLPAPRPASMLSPNRFRFLNVEGELVKLGDWNSEAFAKLWLYNLHYFDDLNAEAAIERVDWHRVLIHRWIEENPPGTGNGWEPYPLSLRIINWIKWHLAGNELDSFTTHSLAVQVRFLICSLEYHILGNHLFVNAKALVFAGCFFEGEEAKAWLRKGLSILDREIPEQILGDGGQFERSPMYHALAYEDMLDLLNLSRAFPEQFAAMERPVGEWEEAIQSMGHWLRTMCHPDGEIAFFNDAAIGIAPSPEHLFDYAKSLGLPVSRLSEGLIHLDSTGYIRLSKGEAVLLIDVAPIGPDYLPGHAHADTLSYELSLSGKRVLVNSGTSRYGLGTEREWERSTAAHNTVEVDGQSSSEVWSSFRVARRAYPFDVSIERKGDALIVEAAHDGFRRLAGRPVHRRRWVLGQKRLEVYDTIEGSFDYAVSRLYFHPDVQIDQDESRGSIAWSGHKAHWETERSNNILEASHWHPEFGLSIANKCLAMAVTPSAPSCRFPLEWG